MMNGSHGTKNPNPFGFSILPAYRFLACLRLLLLVFAFAQLNNRRSFQIDNFLPAAYTRRGARNRCHLYMNGKAKIMHEIKSIVEFESHFIKFFFCFFLFFARFVMIMGFIEEILTITHLEFISY